MNIQEIFTYLIEKESITMEFDSLSHYTNFKKRISRYFQNTLKSYKELGMVSGLENTKLHFKVSTTKPNILLRVKIVLADKQILAALEAESKGYRIVLEDEDRSTGILKEKSR